MAGPIEDNPGDARLAIEALKDGGVQHRLTLIPDGTEAMQFLHREKWYARAPRPDLILLDLNLPGMDGRLVLQEIKNDVALEQVPVVILTASQDHEDLLRSEQLNVDGYMTKPVDMPKFITLVKQLKSFWHAEVMLPVLD